MIADELAILADDLETNAWKDLYEAAPPQVRSTLGIRHAPISDATLLIAPGVPAALFNRAIGLGNRHSASLDAAEQIAATYARTGASNWWLHVNSAARPERFERMLSAGRWRPSAVSNGFKMMRPAGDAGRSESRLVAAPATDLNAVDVVDAIAQAFGLPSIFSTWLRELHGRPGWRLYGVFDGKTAVGGGALFLDGAHAWMGIGSVIESARRRGGQRAVMTMRINEATRAGAKWIASETMDAPNGVNPSLTNMQCSGFRLVASRANFSIALPSGTAVAADLSSA